MDVHVASTLLGGLAPAAFMRRHWQTRPMHVRGAWPGVLPPLSRAALFALAGRDGVESRLVQRRGAQWQVRQGPLPRRALPPVAQPGWTLLVQGLDLHVAQAHRMLQRFRFVPDARLDDLMVSWASPGGGVGPHADSYDVFLLQVQGSRRWRVAPPGRAAQPAWVEGAPLKLLRDFQPQHEWLLDPGDLLYLPPRWGHEGTAEGGDCMTCSVGFRAPAAGELARELLLRLAERDLDPALYRDRGRPATATPAALPQALLEFAQAALARHLADPLALPRALGEVLSEPKPQVWFEAGDPAADAGVELDPRTRMLYDPHHVFVNGVAYPVRGRDAALLQGLADARQMSAAQHRALGAAAQALVHLWLAAGWAHTVMP